MADFLNLFKIKNLKTGTISDFVDEEGVHDFLIHLKTLAIPNCRQSGLLLQLSDL